MNEFIETASIWLPGVLTMVGLILASGFFSGSETALFYLSREELRQMSAGTSGERLAASMMRNPDRLLTVVLFWNLVINLAYFSISLVIAKRLVDGSHNSTAGVISVGALVGMILFGEVAPKSLAVIFRKQIAVWASWPLALAARVLDPVLPLLGATTRGLRRAIWPKLKHEPYLEFDDIERAVDTSTLGAEMVKLEQQILSRILDIVEMRSEELMRPRGSYKVWEPPIHIKDLRSGPDNDDIILISNGKADLIHKAIYLRDMSHLPNEHIESVAEDVIYVPWCGTVSDTLSQLRNKLLSVACVINEYGEIVGVITEDDIIDTLMNPNSSRTARLLERDPIRKRDNGYLVDGLTTLRYLAERLGFDFDPAEDEPLTVTALLHSQMQRFPEVGDTCSWQGYTMTVHRAGERSDGLQVTLKKGTTEPHAK